MTTLGSVAEFDKERVRRAFRGELYAGDDVCGSMFEPAPSEACERAVLEIVDSWYCLAKQLADSGRATEAIMRRHGWRIGLDEFVRAMAEAEREHNTFLYEYQKEELADEIGAIEDGS